MRIGCFCPKWKCLHLTVDTSSSIEKYIFILSFFPQFLPAWKSLTFKQIMKKKIKLRRQFKQHGQHWTILDILDHSLGQYKAGLHLPHQTCNATTAGSFSYTRYTDNRNDILSESAFISSLENSWLLKEHSVRQGFDQTWRYIFHRI